MTPYALAVELGFDPQDPIVLRTCRDLCARFNHQTTEAAMPKPDQSLRAIRIGGETIPFQVEGESLRWLEGGEQCVDCAQDLGETATLVGTEIRCACGARYASIPFRYRG